MPTDEELIASGSDPMSPEERAFYEQQRPTFELDAYVPHQFDSKFFRYQLADFDFIAAEALRETTYDKLIELKWVRRARDQYTFDHRPKG